MVEHHLRWVRDHPERARFLFERREPEVADASVAAVRDLNESVFAACRDWLEPHWRKGRIRRLPLELHYVIVLGPSQEYARAWLRHPDERRIAAAGRELARAAWEGVRGDRKESP